MVIRAGFSFDKACPDRDMMEVERTMAQVETTVNSEREVRYRRKKKRRTFDEMTYHAMLLPGMVMLFIFSIVPMFGVVMAFQKFIPAKGIFGSAWAGLDNFTYMFQLPDAKQIFVNTLVIAVAGCTPDAPAQSRSGRRTSSDISGSCIRARSRRSMPKGRWSPSR